MTTKQNIEPKGREYVYHLRRLIADNRSKTGFPKTEDYGIDEDILDDYLYELMDGPQSVEEQKRIYTRYGLCLIIPIAIVALMKQTMTNYLIGVFSGVVLCLLYALLHSAMRKRKITKLVKSGVADYIKAVEMFSDQDS